MINFVKKFDNKGKNLGFFIPRVGLIKALLKLCLLN